MKKHLCAARTIFGAGVLLLAAAGVANADILSSNVSNQSAGTETATTTEWLTASFGTGSSAANLDSVVLLMSATSGSSAELDLYSNGLESPGLLIGSLNPTTSYSGTLSPTSFANGSIALAPNTSYWLVLKAVSGEVDWSWTTDNSGSGVGFQGTWGSSSDSGATWYTYTTFPFQLSVSATSAAAATPEPSTGALIGIAAISCGALATRERIARKQNHG